MTTPGLQPTQVHIVATGLVPEFFSSAAWSPDGRRLAFVRPTEQGSNGYEGNICVFDVTTGTDRQLTFYEETEHYLAGPAWSPDGAWIAYSYSPTRTAGGIDYRIWRTSVSSFNAAMVTEGRIDSDPAWGPGGDLVFCRGTWGPPNIPELWIASPNTWAARQLTFDQLSRKRHPSVNGRTGVIAYAEEPLGSLDQHLYAIDPGGGSSYPLTSNRHWTEREPAWAADGMRVIFTSDRSGHREIWSHNTVSGAYLQLTRGLEERPARTAGALSPDGTLLAYREELRYTSRGSLIIVQTEP
jgi:Tol biopolymer transport system component